MSNRVIVLGKKGEFFSSRSDGWYLVQAGLERALGCPILTAAVASEALGARVELDGDVVREVRP